MLRFEKMRLLRHLLLVAGIMFCGNGAAFAEEISLSASLDKTDILFEDSVALSLEVRWQGGMDKYAFQILPLPTTQNLKVLGTTSSISSRTEAGQDYTVRTFRYRFTPTQSGMGTIDAIVLNYVLFPDSIPGQLTSQRFQVAISAPRAQPAKSEFSVLIIIAGGIIVIAAAVTIFLILRGRKKGDTPIQKTAEQEALEELGQIRRESSADRKIFFARLHKLLIVYLEHKSNVTFSGKPAREILEELAKIDFPAGGREKISDWLVMAEKEKYAPLTGTPGDLIRITTEMENFFGK